MAQKVFLKKRLEVGGWRSGVFFLVCSSALCALVVGDCQLLWKWGGGCIGGDVCLCLRGKVADGGGGGVGMWKAELGGSRAFATRFFVFVFLKFDCSSGQLGDGAASF